MFRTAFQRIPIALVVAALGLQMNNVHALRPESNVKVAPATTPTAFAVMADTVRKSMEHDGRYGDITRSDREKVEADLERIAKLLELRGSAEKLHDNEWVLLVNAQERANALLTKNDGDRLICRYERRTGTHFREKTCQTASEIARNRDETIKAFRDLTSHKLNQVGDGGH